MSLKNFINGQDKNYLKASLNEISIRDSTTTFSVPIITYKETSITYTLRGGQGLLPNQNMRITQINDVVTLKLNNSQNLITGGATPFLRINPGVIPSEFIPSNASASSHLGIFPLITNSVQSYGSAEIDNTTGEINIYRDNNKTTWNGGEDVSFLQGVMFVYNLNTS